jgi:hypothetical protein
MKVCLVASFAIIVISQLNSIFFILENFNKEGVYVKSVLEFTCLSSTKDVLILLIMDILRVPSNSHNGGTRQNFQKCLLDSSTVPSQITGE